MEDRETALLQVAEKKVNDVTPRNTKVQVSTLKLGELSGEI